MTSRSTRRLFPGAWATAGMTSALPAASREKGMRETEGRGGPVARMGRARRAEAVAATSCQGSWRGTAGASVGRGRGRGTTALTLLPPWRRRAGRGQWNRRPPSPGPARWRGTRGSSTSRGMRWTRSRPRGRGFCRRGMRRSSSSSSYRLDRRHRPAKVCPLPQEIPTPL